MARRILTAVGMLLVAGAGLMSCADDAASPPLLTTAPPAPTITVEQLVARSADTAIRVQGFLYVTAGTPRLCAAVLESYPPQCGQPSVALTDLDLSGVDGLSSEGDVGWKEHVELEVQRNPDATFRVVGA